VLWQATHIGPLYDQKLENQDAVSTSMDRSRIFFALADGVSTSYGSGFAASVIVERFCSHLKEAVLAEGRFLPFMLVDAASSSQLWLDQSLAFLLANPSAPEWGDVRGSSNLADDVAMRLCENTRNPTNRFWGPVMAATLIGGIIQPAEDGQGTELQAIRIGDGLIELVSPLNLNGGISLVVSMDSEETEILSALSPGPFGEQALVNPERAQQLIGPGETLLISSDGLARGHVSSVAETLRDITGSSQMGLLREDQASALGVLQKAAAYADEIFLNSPQLKLFNDNLSLIVLVHDQGICRRVVDGKE
jgi:serine/threonine protein phosphatase PrpC